MIAERGIEISFLSFFRIDMSMLLGPVLLLELRISIKSDISSGVVGVMKNDSALSFKVIRKISVCWWYESLEFFAYWCKVIIKMFCNIFWLTYSSAVYEKTIRFPCIDFWFSVDFFIDLVSNPSLIPYNFFCYLQNISYSGIICFSLGGQQ